MKSCLVVFYSRTGKTRQIAEEIARAYDCDIEEIAEPKNRKGLFGYMRSAREALQGITPSIDSPVKDPSAYETIIFGTPVWASHVSSPVRSYIVRNRERLRDVAAFCTMGGSGGEKALDEIGALCGKRLTARLAIADRDIGARKYKEGLVRFSGRPVQHPV